MTNADAPDENTTEDDTGLSAEQRERRDEAQERNPDLHGDALEALEGNEDGSGRTSGG